MKINKVYNMNCIEYMKRLPSNSIDLIIADFPYYKCVDDEWDNQWKSKESYIDFVKSVLTEMEDVIKDTGNIIIYSSRQLEHYFKFILEELDLIEQRTIIWSRKRDRNTTRGKTMSSGYEPILWYSKGNNRTYNNIKVPVTNEKLLKRKEYQKGGRLADGISLSDVWSDIPSLPHNAKEKVNHSTQKPLKLCDRIINVFSNENDLIYIPFAGSGSEIVSCINNNRNYIATEINNDYIENLIKVRIGEI